MRSFRMVCAGLALCALGSVAGAAGGGSLGEQVKEGCKAELDSHCKDVKPGEGRLLACLYAYEDKLSSRCDYALYDASMRLERAVNALSHGATECKSDINKHCGKVEAGEGRIIDCLKKHEDKLTKRCHQAMKDIGLD
jgi:Cysteine rich repeat